MRNEVEMKVLICDDQPQFLDVLQKCLEELALEIHIDLSIILFTNPDQVINYIKEYIDIHIIFMDILLGDKNGYDAAIKIRQISPNSKIVFLSSTSAYAIRGYEIKATRYLLKPIKKSKLLNVLKEIVLELQYVDNNYIVERNDYGIHKIFLKEIVYIETYSRNTLIHTTSGEYISYKSMKEHENRLDSNFIRCHSSYIVNMEFIKDYHEYEVYLSNNEKIWVSKNRRRDFLHSLTKFYGKQLK